MERTELNVNLPSEEEIEAAQKEHYLQDHTAGNWNIKVKQEELAKPQGETQ